MYPYVAIAPSTLLLTLSKMSEEHSEQTSTPTLDYSFTSIGVLITVLGQPFKEELFERVLHEHLPWRKVAMGVTETLGDKEHYHMVALLKRPHMWLASNIRGQLGQHAHLEPLKTPMDAVRAMAYLSKHQTPSVWGVTPVVIRSYKLHVLQHISHCKQDAAGQQGRRHYEMQYQRVRRGFFPPKEDPIWDEVQPEDPDTYFK